MAPFCDTYIPNGHHWRFGMSPPVQGTEKHRVPCTVPSLLAGPVGTLLMSQRISAVDSFLGAVALPFSLPNNPVSSCVPFLAANLISFSCSQFSPQVCYPHLSLLSVGWNIISAKVKLLSSSCPLPSWRCLLCSSSSMTPRLFFLISLLLFPPPP